MGKETGQDHYKKRNAETKVGGKHQRSGIIY